MERRTPVCREETEPARRAAGQAPAGVWARAVPAGRGRDRAGALAAAWGKAEARDREEDKVKGEVRVKGRAGGPGNRVNRS